MNPDIGREKLAKEEARKAAAKMRMEEAKARAKAKVEEEKAAAE